MKVYNDFSDSRFGGGCAYCGGDEETRDHFPARTFLSKPYPENLQVVPSCYRCNNLSSKDEGYLAHILKNFGKEKGLPIDVDDIRIRRVIQKYATAHYKYELGAAAYSGQPQRINCAFANQMTDGEFEHFEQVISNPLWPEIGSRLFQRSLTNEDGWIIVQKDNYRYYVHEGIDMVLVRMVFCELLFCQAIWHEEEE